MSNIWSTLEHQVWRSLTENHLETNEKYILAVSGGLDSMVLLEVFTKLKPHAQLSVAYFHHGKSEQVLQTEFRDQAHDLVQRRVQILNKKNILFYSEKSSNVLCTEDEMRSSRWRFLRGLIKSDEIIVTAHHLDDRLETLLLKMIRGTAIDGFGSFKIWNQEIFRPFLETEKIELLKYAQKSQLEWVEDPSNSEEHYLRNWIREKWLKDLDEKVSGGRKNLSKSLLRINQAISNTQSLELKFDSNTDPNTGSLILSRQWFVLLSKEDQIRSLGLFLKKHQIHNFTSGQLAEIQKRLDKNQKDIKFEILGRKWVINASQIMLE